MNPHRLIIVTQSLQFTSGFTLSVVHSLSFDKCITTGYLPVQYQTEEFHCPHTSVLSAPSFYNSIFYPVIMDSASSASFTRPFPMAVVHTDLSFPGTPAAPALNCAISISALSL